MQPRKTIVPLRILFAKFGAARLANRQQYSPKFHWLVPKPRPRRAPRPKWQPRGPRLNKKRG